MVYFKIYIIHLLVALESLLLCIAANVVTCKYDYRPIMAGQNKDLCVLGGLLLYPLGALEKSVHFGGQCISRTDYTERAVLSVVLTVL